MDAILDDPDIQAVSFVGSTAVAEHVYTRGTAHGKRVQAMGGAKNHAIIMPDADLDQVTNELMGAGYGSAGERCMAISVAVPVTDKIADALVARLKPRVESLKIGPPSDLDADYGALITGEQRRKVLSYIDMGVKEGAELAVDGRNFRLQGYEDGFFLGGSLFDRVTPSDANLSARKFSVRYCKSPGPRISRRRFHLPSSTNTAMAWPSLPATAMRRANSPARLRWVWWASMSLFRCLWPIIASEAGSARRLAI